MLKHHAMRRTRERLTARYCLENLILMGRVNYGKMRLFIKRCFKPTDRRRRNTLLNLTDKTIHQSLLTENFLRRTHTFLRKNNRLIRSGLNTFIPPVQFPSLFPIRVPLTHCEVFCVPSELFVFSFKYPQIRERARLRTYTYTMGNYIVHAL